MNFMLMAERSLPEGWTVEYSGGGCYETSKDIGLIGVEVSHEGFANIYRKEGDSDRMYATMKEVRDEELSHNFEVIVSLTEDGEVNVEPWLYDILTVVEVNEIKLVVARFHELYEEAHR